MDNKGACEEISQELARESLIGISYCLPDKVQNSEGVPQTLNGEEKLPVINGDGAEKYRSELISISYSQSPDNATSPVALEDHEDSTQVSGPASMQEGHISFRNYCGNLNCQFYIPTYRHPQLLLNFFLLFTLFLSVFRAGLSFFFTSVVLIIQLLLDLFLMFGNRCWNSTIYSFGQYYPFWVQKVEFRIWYLVGAISITMSFC